MFNNDFIEVQNDQIDFQDSGFLNVLANVTRTGVFTYTRMSPDGTIETIRQLRLPEDVESSMETLVGIPVTNNHPEELVSTENASEYLIGMSSDRPKMIKLDTDPTHDYIQQKITIFDEEAIEEIKAGTKRELSLGYTLDLEEASGEWEGRAYDCIQRNIRYNHLSLVKKGRAGELCKLQLDGKEVNLDGVSSDNVLTNINVGEDMLNIDGVEFTEEKVKSLLSEVNSTKEELAKVTANLDSATAKLDVFEEKAKADENAKAVANDAVEFKAAVKERVALEKSASKVLGEVALDEMSDREIKEKVIASVSEVALDGKSDAYVDARFDMVLESNVDAANDSAAIGKGTMAAKNTDKEDVVAKAKAAAWERMQKGEL